MSASYEFSLSCGDECELWFTDFPERELSFEDGPASYSGKEIMLVQLQRWVANSESDG